MPSLAYSKDRIDLRGDGRIVLYTRTDVARPIWQVRLRIPDSGEHKSYSTKTLDLDEAKHFARNLYDDLRIHVKMGGSLKNKNFKQVFEEWKNYEANGGTTRNGGSWDDTIKRIESYALPFFGSKKIDQIGESEFTEYWNWRRNNFSKKRPSNNTLRRERTCILPVFKFALAKGYITHVPQTNAPKVKGKRRATFSPDEWETLKGASGSWVEAGRRKATYRDRIVARNFFLVLTETGMRVGEARELRWKDLREIKGKDKRGQDTSFMSCIVDGKTDEREVVFQPLARIAIGAMQMLRLVELRLDDPNYIDDMPPKDEHIFCHPDGTPIKEYKHSFLSLLKFAGVPVKVRQGARSLYSFRHFYATQRLSAEVSPFLLAKQMGTSVEMLEKHYAHIFTPTVARQITGTEPFGLKISTRGG